ncbi:MAG: lipoyl(octanoyl) transferase LipB [Betaproteobacteria bacterium]|nr:lipoyl(octanoyl) transferase LipB [Betaproteobacteria bacterium]
MITEESGATEIRGNGRTLHAAAHPAILVRQLGLSDYEATYAAMRDFTASRNEHTPDELWVLEHPPVYTAGVAARRAHFPSDSAIPVLMVDRGGQITYHGPGQAVVYVLVALQRRGLGVRALVRLIERAVIALLETYGVVGETIQGAPGVYAGGAKIAALGLRVRGGAAYHGVSLNVDVDLQPFLAIDPCGYPGMPVTRLADFGIGANSGTVGGRLAAIIAEHMESRGPDR